MNWSENSSNRIGRKESMRREGESRSLTEITWNIFTKLFSRPLSLTHPLSHSLSLFLNCTMFLVLWLDMTSCSCNVHVTLLSSSSLSLLFLSLSRTLFDHCSITVVKREGSWEGKGEMKRRRRTDREGRIRSCEGKTFSCLQVHFTGSWTPWHVHFPSLLLSFFLLFSSSSHSLLVSSSLLLAWKMSTDVSKSGGHWHHLLTVTHIPWSNKFHSNPTLTDFLSLFRTTVWTLLFPVFFLLF